VVQRQRDCDSIIILERKILMTDSFMKRQQELKANLTMQIRDVIDGAESEGRGLDAAELEKIDRIEADIQAAQRSIEVAEKTEVRAAEFADAARGFSPVEDVQAGSAEIFRAMARGEVRGHEFSPSEKRTALVSSVNTVPVSFLDRVYDLARLVGPYLETSEVFLRDSGNDFRIPVLTGYSTANAVTEGSAIGISNATYDSILLDPQKQAFIVQISNELVQDAGFGLEESISRQAGVAIGTRANTVIHTAVTAVAGTGVTSGTAVGFTTDDLISLAYSVDGLARMLPGTGYMANTETLGFIRRLKDGDGRYIYDPVVGQPSTILGMPVYENPAVAAIGTAGGTFPVLFGHWESVKVATTGLQVSVSSDAYFTNDVTGYRFVYRLGASVANGNAHIKMLRTGAA
jgi:HK97 family phage major capsid protein